MGRTCSMTSVAEVKVGMEEEERCERMDRAAREAIAGAPRIYVSGLLLLQPTSAMGSSCQ